jgi:hypothetical protein
MNIHNIINEEINRFLTEDIFGEESKNKSPKSDDVRKGAINMGNGRRGDFNAKLDRETNPNLNNGDAEEIARALDNDVVNVAAVAKQLYPSLTPQGAQSKLRKKIKHIKSDSCTPYKLKKKEAFKARRIIAKEME